MIILLPLLRKLPIRLRAVAGAVLAVLGLAALLVPGLVVLGAIAAVVGLIGVASAYQEHRRQPLRG